MNNPDLDTTKPVVHYTLHHANFIEVGSSALVRPIDHQSGYVSNTTWSSTSEVIRYSEECHMFETQNSMYVGVKPI